MSSEHRFAMLLFVLCVLVMVIKVDHVGELPTAVETQANVDSRCDELTHCEGENEERSPYVCVVCDRYLVTKADNRQVTAKALTKLKGLLSWEQHPDIRRKPAIEEYYTFRDEQKKWPADLSFTQGMALSPRALYYKKNGVGREAGFSCCKRCSRNVRAGTTPRHAIANKNYIGVAPKCLTDLTDVELAFITPVKAFGYCFHWTGGKELRGTLTFMQVSKKSIAKAGGTLEAFGLNDHVLVLFSGNMSERQKKRAQSAHGKDLREHSLGL